MAAGFFVYPSFSFLLQAYRSEEAWGREPYDGQTFISASGSSALEETEAPKKI
jgi:hypothetical protein